MRRFSIARMCSILFAVFVLALIPAHPTSAAAPAKVENFRLGYNGNKSAYLTWDKAKNADYYLIFSCDPSTGQYKRVGKTSGRGYTVKSLTPGKTYYFAVQSVRSRKTTAKSPYSELLEVVGKKINVNVHGRRWTVKAKKSFKAKNLKTGKIIQVKKGTVGMTPAYHARNPVIELKNGAKIKSVRSNFQYGNLSLSKSYKLYSQEQAEAFVNQKGYSSKTKWLVWISQYTSSVHVFKGSRGHWKRMRIAKCVIGKYGHTANGVFHMIRRSSNYGKPQIYFTWNSSKGWGLSIHRRIDKNTRGAYSSGCIRLGDEDLDYVVKHCPMGTTVVSH